MSDTPRTDNAAIGFARLLIDSDKSTVTELVDANFARQLERELAAAEAKLAKWEELYDAVLPFVTIVATTSGRIPTERLSFADWHDLCKAFNVLTPIRALSAAGQEGHESVLNGQVESPSVSNLLPASSADIRQCVAGGPGGAGTTSTGNIVMCFESVATKGEKP